MKLTYNFCLHVFLITCSLKFHHCGRFSGRGGSRPSSSLSRPSSYGSSHTHISSPSTSHHSSSIGWNTAHSPPQHTGHSSSSVNNNNNNIGWNVNRHSASAPPAPPHSVNNNGWNSGIHKNTASSANHQEPIIKSSSTNSLSSNPNSNSNNKNIGWNVNGHTSSGPHQSGVIPSSTNTVGQNANNNKNIGWNVNANSPTTHQSNQQTHITSSSTHSLGQSPNSNNNNNNKNIGWNVNANSPTTHHSNQQTHINPSSTHSLGQSPNSNTNNNNKNIGWNVNANSPTTHHSNQQTHINNPSSTHSLGHSPTSNNGWNIPEKPSSPTSHYSVSGHQTPIYQGPSKVKIVNKYHYHYPGYYSAPVQQPYHPGYYYTPNYYHYSSSDTGSGTLGFFLGYSLGRLTTPTYSHYSFYDGYQPRYDHYTVHHYYHNRETIPRTQEIPQNTIVGCVGDASTICPANTTSLCTSSGALMCVVNSLRTTSCVNNREERCVRSEVQCVNKTDDACKDPGRNTTAINLPCISSAKIYGNITVVNNTIIVNGTNPAVNATPTSTTQNLVNAAVTTTPSQIRKRRNSEVMQNFCVTIVALPAERKQTEGEKLFSQASNIFSKFMERSWGL